MSFVYVIGTSCTPFGKIPDKSFKDLTREAYLQVLADAGLDDGEAAALVETYRLARVEQPDAKEFGFALDCARLHLAIQWLGWSPEWTPPPEHARDWHAELPRLLERVGL